MKLLQSILLAAIPLLSAACSGRISVADLGLGNDGSQNAVEYLQKALEIASTQKNPVIRFPKGVYHFTPEFEGISDRTYNPNVIKCIDNLTIDGCGSQFIFHGKTICFNVLDCKNFTMENFTIDWERPMITQGEFVAVSDEAVRLKIDKKQYPYHIEDGVVWYDGEGWCRRECLLNDIFDKETRDIIPTTHDNSAGDFYKGKAVEVEEGVIEFAGPFNWERRPEVGDVVTMYNYIYPSDALRIENCTNVNIKDITLHHGGSMAVYAGAVDGLTIDNYDIVPNLEKDRYFANMADGFHIKGCKGKVTVRNCEYNCSGDDFFNVHNMYASIKGKISDTRLSVKSYKAFRYDAGDSVWFVCKSTGQRIASNTVKEVVYLGGDVYMGAMFEMEFEKPVPEGLVFDNDVIENAVWCPEVEVCNNRVYKRHRATGVRVTTPRDVDIHDNWFNTAGHAILIEGDIVFWLESGSNENVVIRNNVFDNCMSSGSTTGGRWEWGEAVIDITPSIKAETKESPAYHHNIVIRDNEFRIFDYPILRARSVDNLQFVDNKVVVTDKYQPYTVLKYNFLFEGCRNVKVAGNDFPADMPGHNVATYMMNTDDLSIGSDQDLSVKEDAEDVVKLFEW